MEHQQHFLPVHSRVDAAALQNFESESEAAALQNFDTELDAAAPETF
jgi:hypothetical protein